MDASTVAIGCSRRMALGLAKVVNEESSKALAATVRQGSLRDDVLAGGHDQGVKGCLSWTGARKVVG